MESPSTMPKGMPSAWTRSMNLNINGAWLGTARGESGLLCALGVVGPGLSQIKRRIDGQMSILGGNDP
jgi:hypothetical protein